MMERIKTDGKWGWVGTCTRCEATDMPLVDVYGPSDQVGVVEVREITKQCKPCSSGTVTVRAFDANAPIDENEKQDTRIWSSEGWLDYEAIDGATCISADLGEAGHNARLVEFLESNDLDAYAQWLVLTDGSLVAVQSIDLY